MEYVSVKVFHTKCISEAILLPKFPPMLCIVQYTINVERFAGLDFHGFIPMKFSQENFHSALHLNTWTIPLYEAPIYK